jgi:hypothetical protein
MNNNNKLPVVIGPNGRVQLGVLPVNVKRSTLNNLTELQLHNLLETRQKARRDFLWRGSTGTNTNIPQLISMQEEINDLIERIKRLRTVNFD